MAENLHLAEVLCSFKFDEKFDLWDITYFGKFHDHIIKHGYTEKQDQKQFQIQLQLPIGAENSQPKFNPQQLEDRVIFRNPKTFSAIILAPNYISFHKLRPYENWQALIDKIVRPGLDIYYELGLGNRLIEVQCLYLNRFQLGEGAGITEFINFFPRIPNAAESAMMFQSKYELDTKNAIVLKANLVATSGVIPSRELYFECAAISNVDAVKQDYIKLADIVHKNANDAYKSIKQQEHANRK